MVWTTAVFLTIYQGKKQLTEHDADVCIVNGVIEWLCNELITKSIV